MRRCVLTCAAVMLLLVPHGGAAQSVAIGLKAGTLGPGVGVTVGATDRIGVRVEVPYLSYEHTDVHQQNDFDLQVTASIDLFSVGGLVDFYPFGGGFRISGGALYNANELSFVGRSDGPQTVGSRTYSEEEIGELSGTIELGSRIAPYLGIGFGNPVGPNKRLGMTLDLGVLFQGPPTVNMSGTGMVAPTAGEADKVEANLDWVRYYPGLSIGLTYKLF